MGNSIGVFFMGIIIGACLMVLLTRNKTIDATVGYHQAGKIVYSISIDSNATDSIFGKTWRNK